MIDSKISHNIENILNYINAGVLYCKNDAYSTILYANDYFYTMIGYSRDEVAALFQNRFAEMVIDDVSSILKDVDKSIQEGKDLDFEYRMRKKDGSIIWIHDTARYDKATNCFYVTIMDITAAKVMQHEFERLHLFLNHVPNKIIISDTEGNIVYKNREALNCPYFNPQIDNMYDLLKNHISETTYDALKEQLKKGKSVKYETKFYQGDQFIGHDQNHVIPIKDANDVIFNYMQICENLLPCCDGLTQFPNRTMFENYYRKWAAVTPSVNLCLLIIDIDNFKSINDTYGHLIGDAAILFTARNLIQVLGQNDYICRFGGDEFMILSVNQPVQSILEKLKEFQAKSTAFSYENQKIPLTYSIGISETNGKPFPYNDLVRCADAALYQVKYQGKNGISIYQFD